MICPRCSANIQDQNAVFCNNCGASLTSANQQPAHNNPQPIYSAPTYVGTPPVNKKKNNTPFICLAVIVAVFIICGTAIGITVITNKNDAEIQSQTDFSKKSDVGVVQETAYNQDAKSGTVKESTTVIKEDEYLFPTHNTYLTFDILSNYTADEIDLICNEMYARHGQIFKKQKNRDYFSRQSWYEGKYTSMQYVVTLFNSYEKANLETIANYRDYMGWD